MKIGLIAPPFIPVPPKVYGGTELFVGHLAEGLKARGIEVVVYANGESTVDVEVKALYPKAQWPLEEEISNMRDVNHTAWAIADAARECDIIHLNNAPGIAASRFVNLPFLYTVHHPHEEGLSEYYAYYPNVQYVTISEFQRSLERMPKMQTIHHGILMDNYRLQEKKQPYLSFIGRLAPVKGVHLAIAVAKKAGIPLKIAGEVQPVFKDYYESKVKPEIDGKLIEYIGEADLKAKNELLGNSMAMLFPIQWNEPFGLAMVEAMACGTPVVALLGGSVPEIVRDDISGYVCNDVESMAERVQNLNMSPLCIRRYAEENFSVPVMVKKYIDLYESICGGRRPLTTALDADDVAEIEGSEIVSVLDEPGTAA